jgi:hypothetical protein
MKQHEQKNRDKIRAQKKGEKAIKNQIENEDEAIKR